MEMPTNEKGGLIMILYECKIKYEFSDGQNQPGMVKETYVIEGLSPADVEKRLIDELKPYIVNGDSEVPSIKKKVIYDILPSTNGDVWFKAKVEMITVEDDKESRHSVTILVQEKCINTALRELQKYLASLDCEVVSIARTPIMEVWRTIKTDAAKK